MGGKRRYYLSQSRSNEGRKAAKGLHVAIWEFHSGRAVPAGHEIHHKDGNTFNFEPDNLECLPQGVHRRLPKRVDVERRLALLESIRPLAASWHRSEAGREWHRRHAAESIRKPGIQVDTHPVRGSGSCVWCGSEFVIRNPRRKYCCSKCQWQASGYARGKYSFVHPYFAASLQSIG